MNSKSAPSKINVMGANKQLEQKLYPTYAPPKKWRLPEERKKLHGSGWKKIRTEILRRDHYRCVYCGYHNKKGQIIDHIDGNPKNNSRKNLQTICRICNLIKHSGMGVVISGTVDLYKKSKFDQITMIKKTRYLRARGINDRKIIKYLGLEQKMPFIQNKNYLKKLYGFPTSRKWSRLPRD